MKAANKFCLIVRVAAHKRAIAATRLRRSALISMMSMARWRVTAPRLCRTAIRP